MDKTKAQVWNTCGYVRLSREDGDKEESNSATGQKDLIRDYMVRYPELRERGMKVDDGFTGSNSFGMASIFMVSCRSAGTLR